MSQLLNESQGLFANPCIGELSYEATATAISMAGIFSAFLVEYVGDRVLQIRAKKQQTPTTVGLEASEAVVGKEDTGSNGSEPHVHNHVHTHSHGAHSHGPVVNDKLAVVVMEAGIIFHSIRKVHFLYSHWNSILIYLPSDWYHSRCLGQLCLQYSARRSRFPPNV